MHTLRCLEWMHTLTVRRYTRTLTGRDQMPQFANKRAQLVVQGKNEPALAKRHNPVSTHEANAPYAATKGTISFYNCGAEPVNRIQNRIKENMLLQPAKTRTYPNSNSDAGNLKRLPTQQHPMPQTNRPWPPSPAPDAHAADWPAAKSTAPNTSQGTLLPTAACRSRTRPMDGTADPKPDHSSTRDRHAGNPYHPGPRQEVRRAVQ